MRGLAVRLLLAAKRFPLEVGSPHQLIKKGSGDVILLSNLWHLAIEALMEPREPDHCDTGVRCYIVASDKLHRTASGWWWMVMNRGDAGEFIPINPTTTSMLDRLIFPVYAASKGADAYQEAADVPGTSYRRRGVLPPAVCSHPV